MPRESFNQKTMYIAFDQNENFATLPNEECLNLTLVTGGNAFLTMNGGTVTLIAPCLILSSWYDRITLAECHQFAAKSFRFHPTILNKSLTFESLRKTDFLAISDEHDCSLLNPFLERNDLFNGIINPLPQTFLRISEWFDIAGKESQMRSDKNWIHRVRRCLYQILFELEAANSNDAYSTSDTSIINVVLEYIHAHFSKEISLEALCKLVYLNRTSLNRKFKLLTRRTPIDYLLHHRLSVACELLTHSSLSIGKIVEMTGFKYESYFTRQFTAKIGATPTQYRQNEGFETLNTKESSIVDEF